MKCRKTRPVSNDDSNMLPNFGLAQIKMEGGISNPDEWLWECDCEKCQERYKEWKEKFDAEQEKLRSKQ